MKNNLVIAIILLTTSFHAHPQRQEYRETKTTLENIKKINDEIKLKIGNEYSETRKEIKIENSLFENRMTRKEEKSPLEFLNKLTQTQQVIPTSIIEDLKDISIQENISKEFCKKSIYEKKCFSGFSKTGNSAENWAKSVSMDCQKYEPGIKKVMDLITDKTKNNLNWISADSDASYTIIEYFKNCSTSTIPLRMNKITGLIIDYKNETARGDGIVIDGKTRPILGMAAQIQEKKIYTAKHVIYMQTDENIYKKRDISTLAYMPFGSLALPIPLTAESSEGDLAEFDMNDIAGDQIQLSLAKTYDPGVKFAIIKKNDGASFSAPANIMIPSFMIILSQAKSHIDSKMKTKLENWTNYVVRDNRQTCKMIAANDVCILHSCTTIGGVSGSPIFLDDEGSDDQAPIILAVHHGEAASTHDRQCNAASGKYLNTGAIPNFNLN